MLTTSTTDEQLSYQSLDKTSKYNSEIFSYFLLRNDDIRRIELFYDKLPKTIGDNISYNTFIISLHLKNNDLIYELFSMLTNSTMELPKETFLYFCLYFSLLDIFDIYKHVMQLMTFKCPDLNPKALFEKYLNLVPVDLLSFKNKEESLEKFEIYKYNIKFFVSYYEHKKLQVPFLIPLIEVQTNFQKYVVTKMRSEHLKYLRKHYYEILAYKELNGKFPPMNFCVHIQNLLFFHQINYNIYEYDHFLPLAIVGKYTLPSLYKINNAIFSLPINQTNLQTISYRTSNNTHMNTPKNNVSFRSNIHANFRINNSNSNINNNAIFKNRSRRSCADQKMIANYNI